MLNKILDWFVRIWVGLVVLFIPILVFCPTAQADYKIYGLGASKCWRPENFDAAMSLGFEAWLGGYITGLNAAGPAPSSGFTDVTYSANIHEVEFRVSAWCAKHPDALIAQATMAAILEMAIIHEQR